MTGRRNWARADGGGSPVDAPAADRDTADRDTAAAPDDAADGRRTGAGRPRAPRWLEIAGAWAWRLIALGVVIYFGARVISTLRIVVLPCAGALLLTALLQPLAGRLRRAGLPSLAATWCAVLAAIAALAGAFTLIAIRISDEYGTLVIQLERTTRKVQHWLITGPFHLHQASLQQFSNTIFGWLNSHRSVVAGTVVTGGRIAVEIGAGLVLMIFVTFFLIKDGDRIWNWITGVLRPAARARTERAGNAAWQTLVYYIRGTVLVAAIHAVVIGLALLIIGAPLLGPLVLLVFVAAFVPLIGILIAGFVAILVTLGTKGLLAALVLLAVFVLENQVESHLLQPLVMGRIVRLHPLAIILVLAVGEVVGGIPGAIVAVPTAAALYRALPLLHDPGGDSSSGDGSGEPGKPAGRPGMGEGDAASGAATGTAGEDAASAGGGDAMSTAEQTPRRPEPGTRREGADDPGTRPDAR